MSAGLPWFQQFRPAQRLWLYERYVTGGARTYADLMWLGIAARRLP